MKKQIVSFFIFTLFGLTAFANEASHYMVEKENTPQKVIEEKNNLKSTVIYSEDKRELQSSSNTQKEKVKEIEVTATAYTAYCSGCSGTTKTGINLRENPNEKVIAVDPEIIPLGTKVWVEGYGEAIAGDTGSAIKGKKIDVFIPSHKKATEWGVKNVNIKILS